VRLNAGTQVALVGLALILGFTAVTAATAPPLDAGTDAEASGPTLVGSFGQGWDGSVSELDAEGDPTWRHTGPHSYTSVERLPSGNVLVGYQDKRNGSAVTGVRILTPENRTVWRFEFDVATGRNSEVHDAERLPLGDILVAGMDRERVFIIDRSTKAITWQWNASSHYQAPADPLTRDWLHINDVDRIGDGRYLVSVRNANQLLIIERGAGVVETINDDREDGNDANCQIRNVQLAGDNPRCGDPSVLNHQHNPQWLGEGAVLVADSENDRVVELHRQSNGTWTVAWAVEAAGGIGFDWPRDADRLANGNTLIVDTRNNRLVEIDRDGTVVWTTRIPEQSYAAVRNGAEYPSGPQYSASEAETASGQPFPDQPFAGIGTLYGALRHALPLPYWVGEWHVLVSIVGVVLIGVGIGEIVRERGLPELRDIESTHD